MMVRSAIGSIAARIVIALSNLLIFSVAGHRLGKEGLGTIGLIVLGITLAVLMGNVVCGPALTYLATRVRRRELLWRAYGWAALSVVISYTVIRATNVVPGQYVLHVMGLALLTLLFTVHTGLLVGQQRIRAFNWIAILQSVVLLVSFTVLSGPEEERSVMAYVKAGYIANSATILASLVVFFRAQGEPINPEGVPVWRSLFRHGGFTQLANALQLLTYRCSYWLIDRITGTPGLGVFSVGTQVAESAWLAPRGLATVLYGKLSNTTGLEEQRTSTIIFLKASLLFAAASMAALILMPNGLYETVFGGDFSGIPMILLYLLPGILAMSVSQALGMFFSGTGRNQHNAIGSGLGLAVTVVVGLLIIPEKHLHGAAVTASLAYMINTLYQAVVFMRVTNTRWTELIPTLGDLRSAVKLVQRA